MREQAFWCERPGFRARRGDMSPIILQLLLEKPMHGYEIISLLEEKSRGMWRPSAGAVYPNLQMLEEQSLVVSKEDAGKKVYSLTEAGKKQAEEGKDSFKAPWDCNEEPAKEFHTIRITAFEMMSAFRRVASLQSEEKTAEAIKILQEAKKKLDKIAEETT